MSSKELLKVALGYEERKARNAKLDEAMRRTAALKAQAIRFYLEAGPLPPPLP